MSDHKFEKILVCDDDNQFRGSIYKILEKEGYDVAEASVGKQAVEMSKNTNFDIIIMDIRMPDMDGIDTLRQIKEIQGNRPCAIIIVTGYASEYSSIEALKLGASDYLIKPFEMSDFMNSLNKNIKYITVLKDREYFYRRMLEKSEQLKLSEKELNELKKRLTEHDI